MKNTKSLKSLAHFLPFFDNSVKIWPLIFPAPQNIISPFFGPLATLSFSPSEEKGCRQEQKRAVKSNRNPQKHFTHRQVPSQLQRALSNEKPEIHIHVVWYLKTTLKLKINIL
jgi:hypothetical protein